MQVSTFIRFIPLASETSTGAMDPRNRDGMNDETREMRAVALYASGLTRRIYVKTSLSIRSSAWNSTEVRHRKKPERANPGTTCE